MTVLMFLERGAMMDPGRCARMKTVLVLEHQRTAMGEVQNFRNLIWVSQVATRLVAFNMLEHILYM